MSAVRNESPVRRDILNRLKAVEQAADSAPAEERHPRLIPPGLKRDTIILRAREAVTDYHDAMMSGDTAGARRAGERIHACIAYINGGTHFSSKVPLEGERYSAHEIVMAGIKTNCSDNPRWGDDCTLEVRTPMVRAVAEVRFFDMGDFSLQWHVIDTERPFFSETGFRSDLCPLSATPVRAGEPLKDYLARRLLDLHLEAAEQSRMVEPERHDRLHPEARRILETEEAAPSAENEHGQMLMF